MRKNRESGKLVEKAKGNYSTRYKGTAPDLDQKKQMKSAYKSRYSEALCPESEIVVNKGSSYKSRY